MDTTAEVTADCVCSGVGLHRSSDCGAERCFSDCSPKVESAAIAAVDGRRKRKTTISSMDGSNWKTTPFPDDDDIRNSTTIKCNSDALTITAIGPMRANDAAHHTKTSSSAVTDRSSSSSSAPSSLHHHHLQQQRNVVPSHRRNSSSSSSGAKEEEEEEDVEEDDETSMNFFSDDREFDFLKAPLLPRSSSLKSRKTPPGTPTRRKSVRFADALGLDLELVRHILNPDDPPHVPPTACTRFLDPTDERPLTVVSSSYWRLCFPHPAAAATEMGDRRGILHRSKEVSLESCTINNSNRQIHGVVRVENVAYEKDVRVRYTLNGWLTSADVKATYIEHSNDLISDRFSFQLTIPEHLVAHSRLEFAVSFSVANQTFWDNNFNRNYALECVDYQTF